MTKAAHIPFDRSRLGIVDVLNFKDNFPQTLALMPKFGGGVIKDALKSYAARDFCISAANFSNK